MRLVELSRTIPELSLGQAVAGEIEKGETDAELIALGVMQLYTDEWLSRRLVELFTKEARRQLARRLDA
jgi:hypothetical protein